MRTGKLLPAVALLMVLCGAVACSQVAPATTAPTTTTTQEAEGLVKIDLLMRMLNASSSATLRALSRDNAVMFASIVCGAATPTRDGRATLVMRSSTLDPVDAYAFVDTAVSAYC